MASVPVLRVVGDWDVTDIPLRMTGFPGNMRGYFLYTSGRLTSPFSPLSGCDSSRIVYAAYGARIRTAGLYMVVR